MTHIPIVSPEETARSRHPLPPEQLGPPPDSHRVTPLTPESYPLVRWETPRLCRGGRRSLTGPEVGFTIRAIALCRPVR
jgi:hypothetical protein